MALTDLIPSDLAPWSRGGFVPAPRLADDGDPLVTLSREMSRVLDNFMRGFGPSVPARFGLSGA